jgi:hypothetical protein
MCSSMQNFLHYVVLHLFNQEYKIILKHKYIYFKTLF